VPQPVFQIQPRSGSRSENLGFEICNLQFSGRRRKKITNNSTFGEMAHRMDCLLEINDLYCGSAIDESAPPSARRVFLRCDWHVLLPSCRLSNTHDGEAPNSVFCKAG
jgi:hypothetical protein